MTGHYLENATDLGSHNYQNGMADTAPWPFWKDSQDGKTATMVTFGGQTHLHRFVSDLLRGFAQSAGCEDAETDQVMRLTFTERMPPPDEVVNYCQKLVDEIDKVIEGKATSPEAAE